MSTKNQEKNFYRKLFLSTFYISSFTFGGGFVIIPLMRKKFVEEYKWMKDTQMLDLIAIAQSSPGAIAVNASIIIGYRLSGIMGAVIATVATVLPPLIILSIISLFYLAFKENLIVNAVMKGMQAGVAAVIIDVVYSMASQVVKSKKLLPISMMILDFIATYFLKINIILIIIVCGIVGAIHSNFRLKRGK